MFPFSSKDGPFLEVLLPKKASNGVLVPVQRYKFDLFKTRLVLSQVQT